MGVLNDDFNEFKVIF